MKFMALAFLLTLSFSAFAEPVVTLFVTLTPAGSFQAVSKKPKGKLIKEANAFKAEKITVSIESFKTGIDLRDEHFWKHLQSPKNSKATLTDLKAQNGKGMATLEVNGVKKPIVITYTEAASEVKATFNVKASAFDLKSAEYLGVGVSDDVKVEVTLPFKAK